MSAGNAFSKKKKIYYVQKKPQIAKKMCRTDFERLTLKPQGSSIQRSGTPN